MHVNWKEKPATLAYVCSQGSMAKFDKLVAGPCINSTAKILGSVDSDGVVSVGIKTGTSFSTTTTVMKDIEYSAGISIEIEVCSIKIRDNTNCVGSG